MRLSVRLVALCLPLLFLSCKKDNPVTVPTDPPGKQHEISWPSLANSPWPMHHGNPQSTGRSRYSANASGIVAWTDTIPGVLSSMGTTSLVIGPDSTLYFGSSYEPLLPSGQQAYLYALSPAGALKWKVALNADTIGGRPMWVATAPIVTSTNLIIISTPEGYVLAFNLDGTLKWKFKVGVGINQNGAVIDLEGNYYVVADDQQLYSLNPDGILRWKTIIDAGFETNNSSGLSVSPDGRTIYVAGAFRGSKTLYAIGTDGNERWSFDTGAQVNTTPLVDAQGNIYIGPGMPRLDSAKSGVYSINPDGTLRYRYPSGSFSFVEPTIDGDGNLYFTGGINELTSLDYSGQLRWKIAFPGNSLDALVCSGDAIYVSSKGLKSVSREGVILWTVPLPANSTIYNSPAMGIDGTLYFGVTGSPKLVMAVK